MGMPMRVGWMRRGLVEKQGMGEFDGEGELNEKKGFKLPRFWWLETYISLWFFCKDMFRTSLSIHNMTSSL